MKQKKSSNSFKEGVSYPYQPKHQTLFPTCGANMLGEREREDLTAGDDRGVSPEESEKAERC